MQKGFMKKQETAPVNKVVKSRILFCLTLRSSSGGAGFARRVVTLASCAR
jgi:hypothetical protein